MVRPYTLPTNGKKKKIKIKTMNQKLVSLEILLVLGNVVWRLPWMCWVFSVGFFLAGLILLKPYLEPCLTTMIELFAKNIWLLLGVLIIGILIRGSLKSLTIFTKNFLKDLWQDPKHAAVQLLKDVLTLAALCISESCIEIKINVSFYFHTSFWCLKRFYEGL